MGRRKKRRIPAQLESVRRRFEAWRQTRRVRTRIPDPLWRAAVKVAERFGVHLTARTLRIDYYGLKRRVEEASMTTGVPIGGEGATFVELSGPLPTVSGECLVELEDDSGAKMRVHLRGVETPDLIGLSRSFWDALS